MTFKNHLSAAIAALALAIAVVTPASAGTQVIDFTIHDGNWIHVSAVPDGPFGLPLQPTITGNITIDDSKTDASGFLALDYVTGSRVWTLADLNPANSGIFYFNGAFSAFVLVFSAGNVLGSNNTAVISEGQQQGSNTIACNGCVTVDSIRSVPEPASWALMILGFAAIGAMLRRARANGFAAI